MNDEAKKEAETFLLNGPLIVGLAVPGTVLFSFQSYSYILAGANFDNSNHFELLAAGKIMSNLFTMTFHHHHHFHNTMRGTVML